MTISQKTETQEQNRGAELGEEKPNGEKNPRDGGRSISFAYILTLFESDASFQIIFKKDARMPIKYRVQPEVQWSQKDVHLLAGIRDWLKSKQIPCKLDKSAAQVRGGRAPCVRVRGIKNVWQFIAMCAVEEELGVKLYGKKRLNLFLLRAIYSIIHEGKHNTPRGRKKIIDLKFASRESASRLKELPNSLFQKVTFSEETSQKGGLSQNVWEERHQFELNSSVNSASFLKKQIWDDYIGFARSVLLNQSTISADYVSALLEGDGCLYTKQNKVLTCAMSLACERGGELILLLVASFLEDNSPRFDIRQNCTYYVARRKSVLTRLCSHLRSSPLLFKVDRQERFLKVCQEKGI